MGKPKKGAAQHKKGGGGGGKKAGKDKDSSNDGKGKEEPKGCRHVKTGIDESLFEEPLSMDACSMCSKDDIDLVVCLTCALVACKTHAKKHWASSKKVLDRVLFSQRF
jgi:uncharacterized UBP type Zn finger protein